MCVVSMIGDHYTDKWRGREWQTIIERPVSAAEVEQLRQEVEEMKKLLKKAVEYDKRTGQPDCPNEDKLAMLKEVARAMNIDLDEVFK